jgi:hypothetical protein
MRSRISSRIIAPLFACAIAGGAAVVGGACLPSPIDPPLLRSGNFILMSPNFHPLPGTFTDSAGRALRVVADTFVVDGSAQTYEEHARVAITPPGGTEQPATAFVVSRRPYQTTGSVTRVFPVTLYGGNIAGTVLSSTNFQLSMPDRTIWQYELH